MKNPSETKYRYASNFIKDYIHENGLKTGDKLPTEKNLMALLGASRITVRRALKELQEEGLVRGVQGSGVFVHQQALPEKNRRYVPLLLPSASGNNELFDVVRGVEDYLSANGYYPSLHFSHRDVDEEREIIESLVENGADCIIVFPCSAAENQHFFARMQRAGTRFVFLDRIPEGVSGNLVVSDNVHGGYIATEHLLAAGCKNVGFFSLSPLKEAAVLQQRLTGYRMALEEHEHTYDENMVVFCANRQNGGAGMEKLFSVPNPPDGLFCATDYSAIEALKYLDSIGRSVPRDVAVIGFDNMSILENGPYALSTIEQPFFRIGYEAARIADQILCGELAYSVHKILPVRLIERASTRRGG